MSQKIEAVKFREEFSYEMKMMLMEKPIHTGHQHPLSAIYHRDGLQCDVCDRSYRHGLSCEECKFTIHVRCTFVFRLPKKLLNHPSHDHGHATSLQLLTTGAPPFSDPECHICGNNTKRILYHCTTCNLNMHIDCMIGVLCNGADGKRPRLRKSDRIEIGHILGIDIVESLGHPHPMFVLSRELLLMCCDVCGVTDTGLFCLPCRFMVHRMCVNYFDVKLGITSHCHAKHSLKLLTTGPPNYTDPGCHICGNDIECLLYHCDICKFNLDIKCALKSPPETALSDLKVHEHTVTLMPRLISFVCDVCGMKGDRAPYVCLQCNFMVHRGCAHLPRVIHVNRHQHRVSYKYPIGRGEWNCEICLEEVNWSCGGYSCSLCPNYVVHSTCATTEDVWDGEDLDGKPEEVEDVEPYKINDDNTITHFAHEHNMSLNKEGNVLEESIVCGACVQPIGSSTFYYCSDCSFILHETCANLPTKKRLFLSPRPLTIDLDSKESCGACLQRVCKGFVYWGGIQSFDLICSSITVPFTHGSHPHPLVSMKLKHGDQRTCNGCNMITHFQTTDILGCTKCNYFLDFRCATLPTTIRRERYDNHPLTLCYGEKASGKYWCDICERETIPETWFYTCKDCGVTLHIYCVFGDIRYAKATGGTIKGRLHDVELLPNNKSSRPFCDYCGCRCQGPFILTFTLNSFLCSYFCYAYSQDFRGIFGLACIRPPWIDSF